MTRFYRSESERIARLEKRVDRQADASVRGVAMVLEIVEDLRREVAALRETVSELSLAVSSLRMHTEPIGPGHRPFEPGDLPVDSLPGLVSELPGEVVPGVTWEDLIRGQAESIAESIAERLRSGTTPEVTAGGPRIWTEDVGILPEARVREMLAEAARRNPLAPRVGALVGPTGEFHRFPFDPEPPRVTREEMKAAQVRAWAPVRSRVAYHGSRAAMLPEGFR